MAVLMGMPASSLAQVGEANPLQYAAIAEGTYMLNSAINSQTKGMQKTAAFQGTIAAEFTKMKQWEGKYNAYLKTARGYAEALKAGTTLYADGVQTLQHLYEIQRAVNANPAGIGATLAMNDLYLETASEFIKTYRLLKVSVAKGGTDNMLTGAERTEMLWQLADELARLNAKLRTLAISIAYHNFTDVWNQYTAGMVEKSHGEIAADAYERWRRASNVSRILSE
jgi:uncharacterized phage infection (PIP) family protein YhgE